MLVDTHWKLHWTAIQKHHCSVKDPQHLGMAGAYSAGHAGYDPQPFNFWLTFRCVLKFDVKAETTS